MKREEAESMLTLAGFKILHVWELVNGYWPSALRMIDDRLSPDYTYPPLEDRIKSCLHPLRSPWWLLMTERGPIEIGWRKNVISIDWEATPIRAIVTDDNVTKGNTYVHAWSVPDAVRYLTALRGR